MANPKLVEYLKNMDPRFEPFIEELANLIERLASERKELEGIKQEYPDCCSGDYFYDYLLDEISSFTWGKLHPDIVSVETWEDDDDLVDENYYMTEIANFLHNNNGFYAKVMSEYMPLLLEYETANASNK